MKQTQFRLPLFSLSLLAATGLTFFYVRYVPLVPSFQVALVPFLVLAFFLTTFNIQTGTLYFVFVFPLINGLPHFFGIHSHIPHAPTALVLFLFFFFGWLVHRTVFIQEESFKPPVFRPVFLFALFVALSGFITLLKFANFFPFLSDYIYELTTNVSGVSTGGAIMSTLFHMLNYLTGLAFFSIVVYTFRSKDLAQKILFLLSISVSLSLFLGYYQAFNDPGFGNTPFWVTMKQINATFTDPNAFGAILSMVCPVVLGMLLAFKGRRRIFSLVALLFMLAIFPYIGSRSAFVGLAISVVAFFIFYLFSSTQFKDTKYKKKALIGMIAVIVFFIAGIGISRITNARLFERFKQYAKISTEQNSPMGFSPERFFLWKEALAMTKDYPLSGVGMGAYIIELPNYYTTNLGAYEAGLEGFRRNDSAENYFLHICAETGLPGLLAILAVFWLIFRQVWISLKNPNFSTNKILLFGLSAGLLSYLFNLLFHSYIGSFDVKYTFWLLAGLVFVFSRKETEETTAKKRPKKTAIILGLALLIVFAASHLWNSTHTLSLKSRTETFGLNQQFGLYPVEKTDDGRPFRWTKNPAGLSVFIEKAVLEIPLHASHPDIQDNPITVKIFMVTDFFKHKTLLKEIVLSDSVWKDYTFHLPHMTGKDVFLLFNINRTWNPQKALGVPDPRHLGIAIGDIRFRDNTP